MNENSPPSAIGLTGGIATGKSTVSGMFHTLGAVILDADLFARAAVTKGAPAWQGIRDHFGERILAPDQEIDRKVLADIVFADAAARKALEEIVHPAVYAAMTEAAKRAALTHPDAPVIQDIPLLYETGAHRRMDKVIVVYAPARMQRRRLMARNHLTREEAEARIRAQLDIEWKRERADILVDNSGGLEHTRRQVIDIYRQLAMKGKPHA